MDFSGILLGVWLLFLLAVVIGACFWEGKLSKREEWWPGLILPGIFLLFGSMPVLCLMQGTSLGQVLAVFLMGNVLTLILLLIYVVNRGRMRRIRQMEKMKIRDL